MEESSGDEGNMLESFVLSSNILKKGGPQQVGANHGGSAADQKSQPVKQMFRPVVGPPPTAGIFSKGKKQQQMFHLAGSKPLKSLNLSKRGLSSKKLIAKKKKKHRLRRTIAINSLKRRILEQREKRRMLSPDSDKLDVNEDS